MAVELNALRDQIDAVDKQMLELLAQRLALVEKVGEVKSQHGLPIYAPDREAAMLASRRAEAQAMGIPPQLIEDILRRVMRESYASEKDSGFKCLNPETALGGDHWWSWPIGRVVCAHVPFVWLQRKSVG